MGKEKEEKRMDEKDVERIKKIVLAFIRGQQTAALDELAEGDKEPESTLVRWMRGEIRRHDFEEFDKVKKPILSASKEVCHGIGSYTKLDYGVIERLGFVAGWSTGFRIEVN